MNDTLDEALGLVKPRTHKERLIEFHELQHSYVRAMIKYKDIQ